MSKRESYRNQLDRFKADVLGKLKDMFVVLSILNERLEQQEKVILELGVAPGSLAPENPKGREKLTKVLPPFTADPESPLYSDLYGDNYSDVPYGWSEGVEARSDDLKESDSE